MAKVPDMMRELVQTQGQQLLQHQQTWEQAMERSTIQQVHLIGVFSSEIKRLISLARDAPCQTVPLALLSEWSTSATDAIASVVT